jgi:hypothetical protein
VHALLQTSPRARAAQNRRHQTALLKGLIFGLDGRALSPTHSRKKGRMYRYYVAQRVLKHEETGGDDILRRISAAQIEGAVIGQVRALLRQPEIVAGGWLAARQEAPDLSEEDARDAWRGWTRCGRSFSQPSSSASSMPWWTAWWLGRPGLTSGCGWRGSAA